MCRNTLSTMVGFREKKVSESPPPPPLLKPICTFAPLFVRWWDPHFETRTSAPESHTSLWLQWLLCVTYGPLA